MGMSVLERARAEKKRIEEEKARRGANYWRVTKDKHRVRIMPPYDDNGNFFRQFGKHWRIGPDEQTAIFCPQETFAQHCQVCVALKKVIGELYDAIGKNPTREIELKRQIEYVKGKTATPRYYVNLVDMDDPDKGVQVGELPQMVVLGILDIMSNDEAGYGDITHPEKGFDIFINRIKDASDKRNTKYTVQAIRTPSPVNKEWLNGIVNLDMIVKLEPSERVALLAEGKDIGTLAAVDTTSRALPPPATTAAPEPPVEGPTSCFGQFDVNSPKCLDCVEGEDCEGVFIKARREARKMASAETAAEKAPEVVEAEVVSEPAAVPTPEVATAAIMSGDELMAAMRASLRGQRAA